MIRTHRYRKGDSIEDAMVIVRRELAANGAVALEAQPGDGTRYFLVLSVVEIPVYGPWPQYLLSYTSDERSICMPLGQDRPYLVPSYVIEKCPGINPHTACLLCEMVNRIFETADPDSPMFDLGGTGRPTEPAIQNALAAMR